MRSMIFLTKSKDKNLDIDDELLKEIRNTKLSPKYGEMRNFRW